MPTFIKNNDGSYSEQTLAPFDPVATAAQIVTLQAQSVAAVQLASDNVSASFTEQIAALQALLDAFNAQFPQS
jgi:hypothetical protein